MKLDYAWRKSSLSPDTNNCVEVRLQRRPARDDVEVRNSKRRDAGSVAFTPDEWRAFTAGVKAEEFEI